MLGAGVERSAYIIWLRWYGNELRVDLWWPLLKARVLQRTALVGAADSEFGNVAASETSDDDGDEAEAEEDYWRRGRRFGGLDGDGQRGGAVSVCTSAF